MLQNNMEKSEMLNYLFTNSSIDDHDSIVTPSGIVIGTFSSSTHKIEFDIDDEKIETVFEKEKTIIDENDDYGLDDFIYDDESKLICELFI